jgi:hypothetical protein
MCTPPSIAADSYRVATRHSPVLAHGLDTPIDRGTLAVLAVGLVAAFGAVTGGWLATDRLAG